MECARDCAGRISDSHQRRTDEIQGKGPRIHCACAAEAEGSVSLRDCGTIQRGGNWQRNREIAFVDERATGIRGAAGNEGRAHSCGRDVRCGFWGTQQRFFADLDCGMPEWWWADSPL